MNGLYTTALFVLAGVIAYRFHRPILALLARFDARNTERKIAELRDRQDRNAHYKHTIELAEEQVEGYGNNHDGQTHRRKRVAFPFAGEMFMTLAKKPKPRARRPF